MAETNDASSSFSLIWGPMSFEIMGDPELIREAFELLRSEIMPRLGVLSTAQLGEITRPEDSGVVGEREEEGPKQNGAPTVETFVDEKSPKTAQETVAVLAFYLKTYRGTSEIDQALIEKMYNEAHLMMGNVKNAIYNAARKHIGWLKRVQGKKGKYELTAAGENYVKTKLPKGGGKK